MHRDRSGGQSKHKTHLSSHGSTAAVLVPSARQAPTSCRTLQVCVCVCVLCVCVKSVCYGATPRVADPVTASPGPASRLPHLCFVTAKLRREPRASFFFFFLPRLIARRDASRRGSGIVSPSLWSSSSSWFEGLLVGDWKRAAAARMWACLRFISVVIVVRLDSDTGDS